MELMIPEGNPWSSDLLDATYEKLDPAVIKRGNKPSVVVDGFSHPKPSIYRGFPIATFDCWRVRVFFEWLQLSVVTFPHLSVAWEPEQVMLFTKNGASKYVNGIEWQLVDNPHEPVYQT